MDDRASTARGSRSARRRAERHAGTDLLTGQSSAGQTLRVARESLGLSLAEIRDRTGVPWTHLEALEAMELSVLADQRSLLTATRRYAEVVGLESSDICSDALRAWRQERSGLEGEPDEVPTPHPGGSDRGPRTRRRSAARGNGTNGNGAPRSGSHPEAFDRGPRMARPASELVRPGLLAFTQTDEVPVLSSRRPQTTPTRSFHFADTGAVPVARRHVPRAPSAPLWLRAAVAVAASLCLIGLGGLAAAHYEPRWMADIHLTRVHTASVSGPSAPTTTRAPVHRPQARTRALVSALQSSAGSESVAVNASGYQVTIAAQQPCWVYASATSGTSPPVFTGVLQAGQSKVIDPVNGKLAIEFGASHVTVQVDVGGAAVKDWSFSPPTVPYTLSLTSTGA